MGRLNVRKTYKLYINGEFPRTESGRFYAVKNDGELLANACRGSRKDLRNAVVAARKAGRVGDTLLLLEHPMRPIARTESRQAFAAIFTIGLSAA